MNTIKSKLHLRYLKNNSLSRLARDTSGNFGVLTALILIPLLGAAGLAVDVSMAMSERQALMNAADAAALGALSEKSKGVQQALSMTTDGEVTIGAADAKQLFLAQLPQDLRSQLGSVNISILRAGNGLTSSVGFTAAIPTTFLRVLGKDSFTVGGTATASYQTSAFIDFFMLLDNTPSMGLGATQKDIAKLKANTSAELRTAQNAPNGCAFACHATTSEVENTLDDARKLGVKLRIDVVRDATKALTDDVVQYQGSSSGQYRMAVYSFGTNADDVGLTEVAKLSDNMTTVKSAADTIALMSTEKNNYLANQLTDFSTTLSALKKVIGTPGTGASTSSRQKIIFLVSDGVADAASAEADCTGSFKSPTRCMEPINVADCTTLKNQGIKIAVVYTTYLQMPDDSFWTGRIKPFDAKISPAMEACASPGYFIEASPDQDLTAAMQTMFRKLLSTPRLTS